MPRACPRILMNSVHFILANDARGWYVLDQSVRNQPDELSLHLFVRGAANHCFRVFASLFKGSPVSCFYLASN
jgi:hypothetical protein